MRCPVCEGADSRHFQTIDARAYARCLLCEATFLLTAHLPSPQAERAEYELHRNTPDDPGYRRFLSQLATPLLQRLSPASHGLDFGCGPGPVLAGMLREAGHRVALYDPFFHPDPAALNERYDFITCTEVVEHFHRPAHEFRRLHTLLQPGGWLAVMTRFQTDDARFAQWHYRRDPTHVVFYRQATFERLALQHGWSCEVPAPNVVLLRRPSA
ncbi:MAG: class I SAM-dependent methyltransferase [Hydrogenophaga sp.]|uniref:class I SAM-dependent methyltransferase n=1 Tax=Hydrogenophaga sp. TaxID=1904254 RepID=UPI001E015C10|nr:class I SAM-dependent methyltransferase [Hydrogenophaga sp.]MBW0169262.1 class I SAM-dependent methyltransferase [Hydrogenophaga sp.]MBW0183574.1 class I SAM-dependent methyltransferase [Hydrogenophaga sp.]